VVLATGARWRNVNVPGEAEYRNKGVAYCPHCDGPLFKGKDVAVIGGGNSGVEAAIDLAGVVATSRCWSSRRAARRRGAGAQAARACPTSASTCKRADHRDHRRRPEGQRPEVQGPGHGQSTAVELAGVFVQIGLVPNTDWLKGTVELSAASARSSSTRAAPPACRASLPPAT
jgi:alkyl hydroperoxide reductase subunit F